MNFPDLNFPKVAFRFKKNVKNNIDVFDVVRKKFVALTPEEWVRQHLIHYLINHKNVPLSVIGVEQQLILNNTKRRTDLVIFDTNLKPLLIVECKEANVLINQETVNQALNYNIVLNVPYILLTNGLNHICLNLSTNPPHAIYLIPDYQDLKS